MDTLEFDERMRALEERVSALEARLTDGVPQATNSAVVPNEPVVPTPSPIRARTVVKLDLIDKRFDPSDLDQGKLQDHIWMDFVLTLALLAPPTRAVKGALTFCDIFDEPRFRLSYTLTESLRPGMPLRMSGIGFTYNEFMTEHQWMLGTDIRDMKVFFEVAQIIYENGASESL